MGNSQQITIPLTKADYIYRLIKEEILEGKMKPGQRLRLLELSRRYKTSEMPIREALRMLQHDDLVQFNNHRGAMVTDLTLERVIEIISTRTYLEIMALVESIPFHDEASIMKVEKIIDTMHFVKTAAKYSEANRQFHEALYALCNNAFLKAEIDELWNKVWSTRSRSIFNLCPDRIAGATREHEQIFQALKERSGEKVERAARSHRDSTMKSWREVVKKEVK